MSSEFGYIPESPEQKFGQNKGIFTPKDIYDLTRADKFTNYGQLEFIETQTASSDTALNFNDLSSYNVHFMTFNDIHTSVDNERIALRYYENGVLESGSVYDFANFQLDQNGASSDSRSSVSTSAILTINSGNATNENSNGYAYIYSATDSTKLTYSTVHSSGIIGSGAFKMWFGNSVLPQTSFVNAFNVFVNSGTFSGSVSLYGIKEYS